MPDFERLTRKLELDLCDNDEDRRIAEAYHRGLDDARKQVAWLAFAATVIVTVLFVASV